MDCLPLVVQPLNTGMLEGGAEEYDKQYNNAIIGVSAYPCCTQCDATAITARGIAACSLSRLDSKRFEVVGPSIASGVPRTA